VVIPELESLQRGEEGEEALKSWIDYSTFDTEGTYLLREALEAELSKMPWVYDKPGKEILYESIETGLSYGNINRCQ